MCRVPVLRLVVLFVLVVSCVCVPCAAVGSRSPSPSSPLSRWLSSLVFSVPLPPYHSGDISFTIPELRCSNISLGHIASSHDHVSATMSVNVTSVSLTCEANWTFVWSNPLKPLQGDGWIKVFIDPSSHITAALQFNKTQDGLVSGVLFPVFSPSLSYPWVGGLVLGVNDGNAFGSLVNFILDFLNLLAHDSILSELNKAMGGLIPGAVSGLLEPAFQAINNMTRPYLNRTAHVPPVNGPPPGWIGPPHRLVDFTQSSLLHVLDYLLNVVVGANGPLGLNSLIDRFLVQPQSHGTIIMDSTHLAQLAHGLLQTVPHDILSAIGPSSSSPVRMGVDSERGVWVSASVSVPAVSGSGSVNVTGGISSLSIAGLDTWDHMQLLVPYDPHTLLLQTGMDTLNISLTFWVSVAVPDPALDSGADVLTEQCTFELDLSGNLLRTYMQASLDADQMSNLHLDSMLRGGVQCLASAMLNASVPAILFDTTVNKVALEAVAPTPSPTSSPNSNSNSSDSLERDIDAVVTHLAAMFTGSFQSAIPAFFNGLVDGPAREALDAVMQLLVSQSMNAREQQSGVTTTATSTPSNSSFGTAPQSSIPQACPAPSSEPFGIQHEETAVAFGTFTLCWLVICAGLVWYGNVTTPLSRMRKMSSSTRLNLAAGLGFNEPTPHKHLTIEHIHVTPTNIYDYHASPTATIASAATSLVNNEAASAATTAAPLSSPSTSAAVLTPIRGSGPSLAFAPGVSAWWRYGIPFLICLNIAQFMSSNTGIGAGVSVRFKWPDSTEWLYNVFEFLLIGTVKDMWTAGVYPLSLLILIFSGIWPYVKLVLLLFCWVVRPTGWAFLSVKWRHRCLELLDSFGKYSLIDAYVMTLMLVAFRLSINLPDEDPDAQAHAQGYTQAAPSNGTSNYTIPYEPAAIDVFVMPEWGIYSFILATIFSLVLTHMVAHIHRQGQNRGTALDHKKEQDARAQQAMKQRVALMTIGDPKKSHWATSTWWGRGAIAFMLVLSLCMVFGGAVIISFTFHFEGLVSIFLNGDTSKSYSLYSVVPSLFPASAHPNFGLVYIQVVYLVFSFIVPCVHIILLLVMWVSPLTLRAQYKVYVWCQVLNAWSALEVFVLSIIASILEIRQFAAFMVGDKCDFIEPLMDKLGPDLLNGSTKCFDVEATLERGCWVLFSACLFYIVARNIVMHLSYTSIRRRAKIKIGGPAWATPQPETARSNSFISPSPAHGYTTPRPNITPHARAPSLTTPTEQAGVFPVPGRPSPSLAPLPEAPSSSRNRSSNPSPNHQSPSLQYHALLDPAHQ